MSEPLVNAIIEATFKDEVTEEDRRQVSYFIERNLDNVTRYDVTKECAMIQLKNITQKEMRRFGNSIRDTVHAKRMSYQVFPI